MTEIQPQNTMYNVQNGIPYLNGNTAMPQQTPQQQVVNVTSPQGSQVYQYPQTTVYNDPSKPQAASGVNIYIYNPSAIGGSNSTANATYTTQPQGQTTVVTPPPSIPAAPIANSPIMQESEPANTKTKRVVDLTDDYIKTLESYLRSPDEAVRRTGIKELINRFEEDESRYDDEALTALLNIALQDPKENNRMLAMSTVAGGSAHGDGNTLKILQQLQTSPKMYGQEAKMATNSVLKAAQQMKTIPDTSPDKKSNDGDEK